MSIRRLMGQPMSALQTNRGFTMVESLVALVVLCVGMLGIAGLYVITLRSSASAVSRMHAVNLAADLADRIRANRNAPSNYNIAPANNSCYGGAVGAVSCTPDQLAANDLLLWQQQIAAVWPGGSGVGAVTYTPGPPGNYLITVSWNDVADARQLTYSLSLQL